MGKGGDYTFKARCHICSKDFFARYNVAARAKCCTLPTHKCRKGKKGGRNVRCVDNCCRSQYLAGVSSASMDSAIDPRKVLTDAEFGRVWRATQRLLDPEGITLRFIAATGCRLSESLLVRTEALQLQPAAVFSSVRIPTLKRKGRPLRTVHLSNKGDKIIVPELLRWAKGLKPDDLLFPVAKRTLQRALERILEPIKPDRESLVHILRHTRASQLTAAGADLNYVRQQLGWSSLEMAKIYTHTSQDKIVDVLDKIP